MKHLFMRAPDPMVVLSESNDGDKRAKAYRALEEPKQHGGSDAEQDRVVQEVIRGATTDRRPLCRLAAVRSLGRFKDPRCVKGLQDAFYNAGDFSTDIAARIQCEALTALGETENPEVVPFLVDKLKEPPAVVSDLAQQRNDRCIAAARALHHFKDYQATEALFQVMRKDREDIALRECAHEALQESTGKNLPADAAAWDGYLHPSEQKAIAQEHGWKINLASWFH